MPVTMERKPLKIPTYEPYGPNALPFFLEKKAYQGATGRVYPIPYTDRLRNEAVEKDYDAIVLSNEHIEVVLLPEIGGKIHGGRDKHNGYEFIYQNTVIKPAMVGLAGPWVSGGVEFNWPQHHRPTTFMPLEATLRENPDGSKTCWMGEAEPFHRMRGMVGVTVHPGSSLVEAKVVVYNRTDAPLPFMWWNNLAVRVHGQYKAMFPPDVEYGNDHDRRAVISFPMMKGVYRTARPFDYGEGTDATWFSNVKLPTSVMVMRGQSYMDFLGGYDFAANAGTLTVADPHISVGKKMWTWGDGDFGRAWCANLTDNGDRYIELMTGVYTDNQPDFTYIQPGETKVFTQVWYPIRGIGEVVNATRDAALSLKLEGDAARVGAMTTSDCPGARLTLTVKGTLVWEQGADLSPASFLAESVSLPAGVDPHDLRLALCDASGRELAAYAPVRHGEKEPPKARTIPPEPKDVATVEELYLHGAHLEQYKHHAYKAEAYFREALSREPDDLRSNHALGRLLLKKGDFTAARAHLARAIRRLKLRNDNPADTEPLYTLARLERLCGNVDRAYELFLDAAWQYTWRSPALFEAACIDCLRGDRAKAAERLALCLETNARHFAARTLLGYLTGDADRVRAVLEEAPQDSFARFALLFMAGRPVEDYLLNRPEDCIDVALDFARAGLVKEAERALRACARPSQMVLYHLASLTGEAAGHLPLALCFPNRLEDIAVLSRDEWQAQYLLGCLYYDRMHHAAAVAAWERSLALNPDHAPTCRNLAQAYFDHQDRPEEAKALLERALALAPDNARILYELLQLYKNLKLSVRARLDLLEAHADLVSQRDDCYLDFIMLYTQDGQYDRSVELLGRKRFNIYEGGEGKLTRHHGWLYTLLGRQAHKAGDFGQAKAYYENARVYPANYGEGRHYSAQEGNIHYFRGLLLEELGEAEAAREAYQSAAGQPSQITEMTLFAALALEKLGEGEKARALRRRMAEAGEALLQKAHLPGYFGVGMAAPLPFELDLSRQNRIQANLLILLSDPGRAPEAEAALLDLDPHNDKLSLFRKLELI